MSRYIYISLIFSLLGFGTSSSAQYLPNTQESDYFKIQSIPIPEQIKLEVGGMAFNNQDQLAVCTRRGEVWLIDDLDAEQPSYKRFAHGLHEPLGLAFKDGAYYMAQRGELTKIQDTNGDGRANSYESIYAWPLEGNYHEYSYGPVFLPNGDMLVTLNLGWIGKGSSMSKWRGWLIQISPDGDMKPIATGLRSPAGFGLNAAGDIFYTENQGDWVGSGRMTHLELGDFAGNPEGLIWTDEPESPLKLKMEDIIDTLGYTLYEYAKVHSAIKPPSVWFPHTLMGISTSHILLIEEENNFGPFTGQLLVGDQGHSKIMRVFQEKVNGVYQGICFPFREGFSSGVLRMCWGPENDIYVGMTSRGWGATGKALYGLQKLVWNKEVPFEINTVKAKPDGFELEFTMPADRASAANPASYSITDFTYLYHHTYGSPVVDQQTRTIYKVELSQDGRTARLYVEGLREGYINEIKAEGIRNSDGLPLLHNFGYYTLNQIPGMAKSDIPEEAKALVETVELESDKRITKMPAGWKGKADQTVTISTKAGMQYDIKSVKVKANSKIKLVFNNPDDMMHNLLIVQPGKATAVGDLAIELGLQGQAMGYVPDSDMVLYHTNLIEPGSKDIIYFEAPSEPGTYEYVCTFPGHAAIMRGTLIIN